MERNCEACKYYVTSEDGKTKGCSRWECKNENTIKLIIEITKPMYESVQNGIYCGTLYEELKNGIPLDDVKAEIREQQKEYQEWGWAYDDVLDILDNIGKSESTDPNDLTHIFDGVTEFPKDAFKGWTTEELLGHKKDSHKKWWDSFYKSEVKPNE